MTKMENSVYVLEKRYDIKQQSDMFNLDRDVMILTSLGGSTEYYGWKSYHNSKNV